MDAHITYLIYLYIYIYHNPIARVEIAIFATKTRSLNESYADPCKLSLTTCKNFQALHFSVALKEAETTNRWTQGTAGTGGISTGVASMTQGRKVAKTITQRYMHHQS